MKYGGGLSSLNRGMSVSGAVPLTLNNPGKETVLFQLPPLRFELLFN